MDQTASTLEPDTRNEDIDTARTNVETNRAQMTSTIDALKEKLDPNVLTQQARENIQKTVNEKTQELVESAKESAKEFALQAIGGARGVIDHSSDATQSVLSNAGSTVHDTLSHAGTSVQDALGNAGSAVHDTLGNVADSVKSAASSVTDKIHNALPSGSPSSSVQTGGGNAFFDSIKANPLPATLVGVGLVWLLVGAQQSSSAPSQPTYGASNNNGSNGTGAHLTDQIKDKAGDFADAVSDKASDLQDAVSGVTDKVGTTVSQFGTAAQTQATQVTGNVGDWMQSNPLVVGAIVMGVGVVAGLMLPGTPQENQLMGAKRDEWASQTEQTVRQTISQKIDDTAKFVVDKVESVTQELVKTA